MRKKNAFTLIELLAVIAIIAILTVIAVPNILKLYKESKKNIFIAQVRKVAKSSQKEYAENINNTFDCNKDLSGNKYKECTGTIDEDEVTITALGDGAFKNFLMVDVTSEPDSGVFVDLDDLNLVEVDKEEILNEPLIENNSINTFYRSVTGKEYVNKMKELATNSDDVDEEYLEKMENLMEQMRTNYEINNNKISQKSILNYPSAQQVQRQSTLAQASSGITENLLIYEVNFTDKMKGNYQITNFNFEVGLFLTETDLNDLANRDEDDDPNIGQYRISSNFTFTIDKAEKAYIVLMMMYGEEYDTFSIERVGSSQSLQLIGPSTININVNDVKKYTDQGIKNRGNKVTTDGDFYSYTNIREKEGSYRYYYILKTTDDIKILKRIINVFKDTSLDCFKFKLNASTNSYSITDYYDNEKNDPYGKACPRDVYTPDKYNGKNIEFIENYAFEEKDINSIKLPNYLKRIDGYSFEGNNLTTILLPDTLEKMGWSTFESNNISYIEYNGKSRFCTFTIGRQKNDIGPKKYYNGKTSGDFLVDCPE